MASRSLVCVVRNFLRGFADREVFGTQMAAADGEQHDGTGPFDDASVPTGDPPGIWAHVRAAIPNPLNGFVLHGDADDLKMVVEASCRVDGSAPRRRLSELRDLEPPRWKRTE